VIDQRNSAAVNQALQSLPLIMHDRASAAAPIVQICAGRALSWRALVDVQNGGAARVIDEQAKSRKVTLSLAAMRPDRCSYVLSTISSSISVACLQGS
jgi:hypothetical protein